MARKTKKPALRFDASLTCGEVHKMASRICDERTDQMTKELVDAYIDVNHADHIRNNEVVYQKLLDVVKRMMRVSLDKSDSIYVSVINADYDIRCGHGNGMYI
jgi:hypothetical protein